MSRAVVPVLVLNAYLRQFRMYIESESPVAWADAEAFMSVSQSLRWMQSWGMDMAR